MKLVVIVRGRLRSPEEQSIVHALRDEYTLFFLQLLPDCIKSVLLRDCQVPKTTRGWPVIRVGDPWWEWRCGRGCSCGHNALYLYRYWGVQTVCEFPKISQDRWARDRLVTRWSGRQCCAVWWRSVAKRADETRMKLISGFGCPSAQLPSHLIAIVSSLCLFYYNAPAAAS